MNFNLHLVTFFSLIFGLKENVLGLYEDQAGKFDWVNRYIGSVEYVVFDASSTPSRKVIVSTDQNVVAALSTRSGDIIWRHILEAPSIAKISALKMQGDFVSVIIGNLLRSWNVITAAMKDEVVLPIPPEKPEMNLHLTTFGNNDDVFYVGSTFGNTEVITFDSVSGSLIQQRTFSTPWLKDTARCATSLNVLVCLDLLGGNIYSLELTSSKSEFISRPLSVLGISNEVKQKALADPSTMAVSKVSGSDSYLLLKMGDIKKLIHVHKDGIHVSADVSKSQAVALDEEFVFTIEQTLNSVTLRASELAFGNELEEIGWQIDLPLHTGVVQTISVIRFTRKDGGIGVRVFVGCLDHSIHLISSTGVVWSREEALANILAVESIDLPSSGISEVFDERLSEDSNVFSNFFHRLKSQMNHLIFWSNRLFTRIEYSDPQHPSLVRDQFNMHKFIVVVTASGKVIALDTRSGESVWSVFLPSLAPFKDQKVFLFIQRTSAHFPSPPQCVVVGRHKTTGNALLYVFNPLTGNGIEENGGLVNLDYPIVQASLLHQMDENFLKPLLLIDHKLVPRVFPRSGELLILQSKATYYVHLVLPNSGLLKGYSFMDSVRGNLQLTEVWSANLGSVAAPIIGVFGKRPNEKVHSQGRVLADRSVLYKYSNPNLAVITTYGRDDLSKNTLIVYLVDTVTGSVLESVVHKRVSGPFHVVHSENWIVYTCYNEKFRRHEVTSLELYEGLSISNLTAFSSFGDRAAPPIVEKQAFILPQGVRATGHTTTERGITTRFILFALNTGNVVQMSKWILDPRRPMTQAAPREEGLIPYMPELTLAPQEMINHNYTLPRASAIFTAPTGLESTCLVFIHGLDVFYTRVFPSKMFDVLKDDFDHYLIIGVLLSLTVAVLVTRKLSQRKALKNAWK